MLLDEATAFADPENEHLIQKALKELSRGKTTLMIAHRLTSVRNVDRILVIENGRIAEEGTHGALLNKGGLYKTMWDEYPPNNPSRGRSATKTPWRKEFNMRKYFQNKFAMSEKGAKNLIVSIVWSSIMDISFMIPVIFGFQFLDGHLSALLNASSSPGSSVLYYVIMALAALLVMFVIAYFQYDSTYTRIYEESARRRISLAETLRKLPLAFFGKKDIADLSATIMEDATQIEQLFSHAVPQIFAAAVTIVIMGVMMFIYNWQMSLAVFWVVPVALLVFYLSRKFQNRLHTKIYHIKRDISDNIQEGLDSVHEIKSYNREDDYANTLNTKLDNYEKFLIGNELLLGALINFAHVLLKLGLPSVILAGAYLLATGSVSIFAYLVFLVVAARVYNPIMEVLENLAVLLFLNVRIKRMKEMDAMPEAGGQNGIQSEELRYCV